MILFNRNQDENFLFPKRLVFEAPPGVEPVTPGGLPEDIAEPRETFDKNLQESQIETKAQIKAMEATLETRKRLLGHKEEIEEEEVDETGPAKEYIETFKNAPTFDKLAATLSQGMESDGTDSLFNFENWLTLDKPSEIGDMFGHICFPSGKGRLEFVEGLKMDEKPDPKDESPEAKKYRDSRAALEAIVAYLREYFKTKQTAIADTRAQIEKGPLGQTVGGCVSTLMTNFNRGSGTEKAMMLGAIGIGIYLLYKNKDKVMIDGWKGSTLGNAASWAAALFAINYLSGKVSKDGRTLVQRLDVARDIDELRDDNVLKAFMERNGMGKDQERLKAFYALENRSVPELFALYEDASSPSNVTHEIDPQKLGLKKDSISGAAIYSVMQSLVEVTAENELIRKRKDEAAKEHKQYVPPSTDEIEANLLPGRAMETFRRKYIYEGSLGGTNQTLVTAIINEYRNRDWRTEIAEGKRIRLPNQAYDKAKDYSVKGYRAAEKYGPLVAGYVWGKTKDAWKVTRDYVLDPAGNWVKAKFNQLSPHVTRPIETAMNHMQAGALEKVLPPEFALVVTEPDTKVGEAGSPGKATIMGYPGLLFVKKTRTDGKEVITIEDNEFVLEDGVKGNATIATKLETLIKGKVNTLIADKKISELSGLTPTWDEKEKKWVITGVPTKGEPALLNIAPGGTTTVSFNVNEDGKDVKFFLGSQEITDFKGLDLAYRDAQIEKKLWDTYSVIKDMPVIVEKGLVGANKNVIKGTIAGLEFMAVPNATGSLDFYDGTKQGGMDVIKIKEDNGGDKFLHQYAAKIFETPEFQNPFVHLESVIDNTDDSVWERVKLAFATTRLWIFPTNVPEAINGRVLKQQWKYMLDYKRVETLDRFRYAMQDKPLSDLRRTQKDFITDNLVPMEDLAKEIEATKDDKVRAEKFPGYMDRLETMNYTSPDYIELFKEYKAMITDSHYNYEGVETFKEVPLAGTKASETYQVLLHVWNYLTDQYSTKSISPADKTAIRLGVIEKIKAHLEAAQQSGGVIKLEELPAHDPEHEENFSEWVDPNWALQPGKKKAKP